MTWPEVVNNAVIALAIVGVVWAIFRSKGMNDA
jgi:hypothetical protein